MDTQQLLILNNFNKVYFTLPDASCVGVLTENVQLTGNILSNCPFIAAKQASNMHTPEPLLNDCSSIHVSKFLFTVV